MSINKISDNKTSAIAAAIPVLLILFPLIYSLFTYSFAQDDKSSQPFLEKPDAKFENCVKETEYMRYHHWELLRTIREEVVRYGKRGEIALDECRECHTSSERFCNQCHNAVNLRPNCFSCHYYP